MEHGDIIPPPFIGRRSYISEGDEGGRGDDVEQEQAAIGC